MRKLVLVIFTICFCTIPLWAFTETEMNDTPPAANLIPVGGYTVQVIGVTGDNADWFTYNVNSGNLIQVSIVSESIPGALIVSVCTDNPGTVQATLTSSNPTFMFTAQNGNVHYLEVISTAYPNSYDIQIHNANDPTLPVVLSSFTASYNNNLVGLQWTTQSETDMCGYNVLRSETPILSSAIQVNLGIIPSTNTSTVHNYVFNDQEIESQTTYYYWLESIEMNGTYNHYGPVQVKTATPGEEEETPVVVQSTRMEPSYPNPFSNDTYLKFKLQTDMNIKLDIYNLKGEKIKTIYEGDLAKGVYNYRWDGRNEQGAKVASGIYLGRLSTPHKVYQTKLSMFN